MNASANHMCPFCRQDGRKVSPSGSSRKCAFSADGKFVGDNWNCGTINRLREASTTMRESDISIGVIHLPESDYHNAMWIVLNWYKDRGRCSRAAVMSDSCYPSWLNLDDAILAIKHATGEVTE